MDLQRDVKTTLSRSSWCRLCTELFLSSVFCFRGFRDEKGTQTQTFLSGYRSGGSRSLPREGVGMRLKFGMALRNQRKQNFFGGIIPGFCWDIPKAPGKKRFMFRFLAPSVVCSHVWQQTHRKFSQIIDLNSGIFWTPPPQASEEGQSVCDASAM